MAKVAFLQNLAFEYLGTMYLCAFLKKHGHTVDVFIDEGGGRQSWLRDLTEFGADIIGISCTTGVHLWALKAASLIKKQRPGVKIIFGGPHPTFYPEIIQEEAVDMVCRGEGEGALCELADRVDEGRDYGDILNLWVKRPGRIQTNEVRPLIEDLDPLPFPDRLLYAKKFPALSKSQKVFILGRGCPFSCSYCFNQSLKELYKGKGPYVRFRTPSNVVEEIKQARREVPFKTAYFQDDTFGLDKERAIEFLKMYEQEVGLPFLCLVRADLLDEDIVRRLKQAGCKNVFFGIESGSQELRNLILKKTVTDEQIYRAAALLKSNKIRFRTYSIFGLPGESLEDAFKTVSMNIRIRTDFPWSSLLQPFPGTELGEDVRRQGLLEGDLCDFDSSFFKNSRIKLEEKREIENLHKLFYFAVKFPLLLPFIKWAVRREGGGLYDLIFLLGYMFSFKGSERITWAETWRIGAGNLQRFFLTSNK
jgi:anaerobic magnesium-protoporphyrin IX monomethyl ester cyclase